MAYSPRVFVHPIGFAYLYSVLSDPRLSHNPNSVDLTKHALHIFRQAEREKEIRELQKKYPHQIEIEIDYMGDEDIDEPDYGDNYYGYYHDTSLTSGDDEEPLDVTSYIGSYDEYQDSPAKLLSEDDSIDDIDFGEEERPKRKKLQSEKHPKNPYLNKLPQ